jgi:dihydrofolate reductase
MTQPRINIIAAIGRTTRALGKDSALLWRIPEDLRHFKDLTMGHPVIMGSTTYESIGKPLPGRMNIVLSDVPSYAPEGVTVCTSLDDALRIAQSNDREDIFIIGGASVYTHLPFMVTEQKKGEHEGLSYEFITLDKIS